MKKKILFFCMISSVHLSFAQQVLSSQGGSYEIPQQLSVDYTIGEAVIETLSDLTQGFHQTNWTFVSVEDHEPNFNLSAYPNPFVDELIVETANYSGIRYQLIDASGKIVRTKNLLSEKTTIPTSEFAQGTYSLVLSGENELKVIKLIKNH